MTHQRDQHVVVARDLGQRDRRLLGVNCERVEHVGRGDEVGERDCRVIAEDPAAPDEIHSGSDHPDRQPDALVFQAGRAAGTVTLSGSGSMSSPV